MRNKGCLNTTRHAKPPSGVILLTACSITITTHQYDCLPAVIEDTDQVAVQVRYWKADFYGQEFCLTRLRELKWELSATGVFWFITNEVVRFSRLLV